MVRYEFDPKPIDIDWREPTLPRRVSRDSKLSEFWDALRANPGRWAVFRRGFRGSIGCYKKNHPDFEFATRTIMTCSVCGTDMEWIQRDNLYYCPNSCADAYVRKVKVAWARAREAGAAVGEVADADIAADVPPETPE